MLYAIIGSGLPFWQIIALIVGYMVALLIGFSAHEFSHAFVAYKCGDPTAKALGRLSLNPFRHIDPIGFMCLILFGFGWAKPVEVNPLHFKHYKRDMAFVSLAGVAMNLLLAFIFSGVYYFSLQYLISSTNLFINFLNYFLSYSIVLNISLLVFNLIPIYPLDGFNFIASLTSYDNKFVMFMRRYGSYILLILLILPIFDTIYSITTNTIENWLFAFWRLFK